MGFPQTARPVLLSDHLVEEPIEVVERLELKVTNTNAESRRGSVVASRYRSIPVRRTERRANRHATKPRTTLQELQAFAHRFRRVDLHAG